MKSKSKTLSLSDTTQRTSRHYEYQCKHIGSNKLFFHNMSAQFKIAGRGHKAAGLLQAARPYNILISNIGYTFCGILKNIIIIFINVLQTEIYIEKAPKY